MPPNRHPQAWRLSHVGRAAVRRLLATAVLTVTLVAAPLAMSIVSAGTAEAAAASPMSPQAISPTPIPDGGREIPVEGGRIKDWQAMLVAAGGATALMFMAGKVRRK